MPFRRRKFSRASLYGDLPHRRLATGVVVGRSLIAFRFYFKIIFGFLSQFGKLKNLSELSLITYQRFNLSSLLEDFGKIEIFAGCKVQLIKHAKVAKMPLDSRVSKIFTVELDAVQK